MCDLGSSLVDSMLSTQSRVFASSMANVRARPDFLVERQGAGSRFSGYSIRMMGLWCDETDPVRLRLFALLGRGDQSDPISQFRLQHLAVVVLRQGIHNFVALGPLESGDLIQAEGIERFCV